MSDSVEHICEVCSAQVSELRRGRCWGCYNRWVRERPIGLGACCEVCNDRRIEVLRSVELHGAWTTFCHNCTARVYNLEPMPTSIDKVKSRLSRERRSEERRVDSKDERVFQYDRRQVARRNERPQHSPAELVLETNWNLEDADDEVQQSDLTCISQEMFDEKTDKEALAE